MFCECRDVGCFCRLQYIHLHDDNVCPVVCLNIATCSICCEKVYGKVAYVILLCKTDVGSLDQLHLHMLYSPSMLVELE